MYVTFRSDNFAVCDLCTHNGQCKIKSFIDDSAKALAEAIDDVLSTCVPDKDFDKNPLPRGVSVNLECRYYVNAMKETEWQRLHENSDDEAARNDTGGR